MSRILLAALAFAVAFCGGTFVANSQTNPGFNPNAQWCGIQGSIAIRGSANWQCLLPGTNGQVLLSGGPGANPTWNTVSGSGTVTSVQASGGTTGLSFTGGPITGAGTLTLGGALIAANGGTGQTSYTAGDLLYATGATSVAKLAIGGAGTFLKSSGSAPAWNSLALSDLPAQGALTVLANITGGSAVPTAPTVTALLDAAFTTTQGSMLYRNSGGWAAIPPGSSGEFLRTNGPAANPQWQAVSGALGGTVTTINIGSGITSANNPITVTGTITGNAPYRNRIINGDQEFDQRNEGTACSGLIIATNVYCTDRWYTNFLGALGTVQRTTAPGGSGFRYMHRSGGAVGVTGVISGQRIEDVNVYDLASQPVTLSASFASSGSLTITWTIYSCNTTNGCASAKTSIASGTWNTTASMQRFTANATLTAAAANGIAVEFSVGAFTSGTIDFTGVQLEPGSIVTPFERLNYSEALVRAQRYYEKSYNLGVKPGTSNNYSGASSSATQSGGLGQTYIVTKFQTMKRISPTYLCWSGFNGNAGQMNDGGNVISATTNTSVGMSSGSCYNSGSALTANNNGYAHFTADAEL